MDNIFYELTSRLLGIILRLCLNKNPKTFFNNSLGIGTIIVEHDVLRLQVSVDDAFLVQVTQRHGDLSQVETVNR